MKLKLIEMSCPYDHWKNKLVQSLYTNMVTLKLKGYGKNYKDVLPVDTYDFISDHYIICDESDKNLKPISAIRHTRNSVCERFNLPLPCFSMLNNLKTKGIAIDQAESLDREISNTFRNGDVYYSSSMTIDPDYRGKGEISKKIKLLAFYTMPWYKFEKNIGTGVALALKHVKTDLLVESMGYERAINRNKELAHFKNPYFNNNEAILLYLKEDHKNCFNEFKDIFEKRMIIGETIKDEKQVA